jgi:hypothetical protein
MFVLNRSVFDLELPFDVCVEGKAIPLADRNRLGELRYFAAFYIYEYINTLTIIAERLSVKCCMHVSLRFDNSHALFITEDETLCAKVGVHGEYGVPYVAHVLYRDKDDLSLFEPLERRISVKYHPL